MKNRIAKSATVEKAIRRIKAKGCFARFSYRHFDYCFFHSFVVSDSKAKEQPPLLGKWFGKSFRGRILKVSVTLSSLLRRRFDGQSLTKEQSFLKFDTSQILEAGRGSDTKLREHEPRACNVATK